MDRILIILKKENGPRASSAPCTGVKYHNIQTFVGTCICSRSMYMQQISGEHLQDHWSSGSVLISDLNGQFSHEMPLNNEKQAILNMADINILIFL